MSPKHKNTHRNAVKFDEHCRNIPLSTVQQRIKIRSQAEGPDFIIDPQPVFSAASPFQDSDSSDILTAKQAAPLNGNYQNIIKCLLSLNECWQET